MDKVRDTFNAFVKIKSSGAFDGCDLTLLSCLIRYMDAPDLMEKMQEVYRLYKKYRNGSVMSNEDWIQMIKESGEKWEEANRAPEVFAMLGRISRILEERDK